MNSELTIDDKAGSDLHVMPDGDGIMITVDNGYRGDRGVDASITLSAAGERELYRYLAARQRS